MDQRKERKTQIQVFSLKYGKDRIVYVSGSGTSHDQTNDVIHLNGLFANKLGICSGEKVIVEPISSVKSCHQVYVEPLSVDDWEILEIHQAYIQSHLLDQVRVITQGQILPIWVDKSVCIFVKIGNIEPPGDCVLLETLTEVIVTPKDRRNQIPSSGTPQMKANQIAEMANGNAVGAPTSDIQDTSNQSEFDNYHDKKNENKFNDRQNTTYFNKLFTWASSLIVGKQNEEEVCDERENDDTDYELELLESSDCTIDTVFRVQRLQESDTCKCFSCDNHYDSTFDSCDTTYKSKSQLSYFTPDKESYSNTHTQLCQYVHHPCNVYINLEDLNVDACHESFFASVEKLASPAEVKEIMKTKVDKLKAKNKSGVSDKTLEDPNSDSSVDMETVEEREIVRVVILNNNKESQIKSCSKLKVQNGHVVVHNLLRQKMSLSLGSKLRLQSVSRDPVTLKSLQLSPLFKVPAYFSDEMLKTAFKFWLRNYTNYQSPLVVNQNTFICIDLEKDKPGEFLVKYSTSDVTQVDLEYTLIDPSDLEDCNITVQRKLAALDPILVDLEEIDSTLPDISNQHLGGFSSYITSAYEHIQTCLATQPVVADIFTENHGIQNGCLLITGSKGSGKTSLAKAVCSRLSNWPSLAHVQMVNCKPLKGKRIETLLQLLEKVSNEASWGAPSVILLDDLDHVTAAPSGPEAEVGGEATYFTRVSEILRDLLKSEITGNSKIALIATARSRSSLHGNLMSSRGTHLFQKVVEIKQPNKEERAAVLKAILEQDHQVRDSCIDTLDLQHVAARTEGFTPKDLVTIVIRALHAHWTDKGHVTDDNVSLRSTDFDNALEDFTPVSLRNVSLHTVGELGWSDVGGLHDVRNTLVDTLMLPSKYPQLFAACPLRLRSGLLLYGPPGSGKTLLAGVVAKECGLNFISIKGPELLNKYIGASEQAVRSTFIRAQSAKPCILFFDEFDSLAPRRGHDSTGVTDRVVNQLLTQLDGVEGLEGVCILAATSRPDLIDPALLRPGRLDKCLHCGIPTKDERLEILEALSRKVNLADDVDLDQVNTYCENFTGADLKALLYNAQLESIHDLQREHKIGSTNRGQHNSGYTSEDTSLKQVVEDIITGQSSDGEQITPLKDGSTIQTDSNIVYMEKLEDGPVAVTADVGKSIQDKLKKLQTGVSVEQEESKMAAKEVVAMGTIVNQSCLVAAVKKMSPSVSAQERMKYEMIYSNFTKAKGSASLERGTRSTLA